MKNNEDEARNDEANKELEKLEEAAAAAVEKLDVMEKIPSSTSRRVQIFEMMAGMSQSRGITDKLTDNHITKILELNEKQIEYEHEAERQGRSNLLFIYIITAIFFLAITVFLVIYNKDSLLMDIMKIFVAFAGGFGVGMGAKSHFDKKK